MSADVIWIVISAIAVFAVLITLEAPIGLALAASGGVGILLLRSYTQAESVLGSVPYSSLSNYSLAIIPMYLLLGMLAVHGHLSTRLFALAKKLLVWLPGGLGVAAVAACAGFSAVSGSSAATAASIGRISVAEMIKAGYSRHLATGAIAAAGTLGILIPPSIVLVMYGIAANESVAQLLMGAVIPGIVLAITFAATVVLIAYLKQDRSTSGARKNKARVSVADLELVAAGRGAPGPRRDARSASMRSQGFEELAHALDEAQGIDAKSQKLAAAEEPPTRSQQLRAVVWVGLIMTAVLIGILTGLFTVIESSALAALVALVMLVVENRKIGVRRIWARFVEAAQEAAGMTSMVLVLFVGSSILSMFFLLAGVPTAFAGWVTGLDISPIAVVIAILVILIPLGMFLEPLSVIIIVVPIVHPVVTGLGLDGIWFAILFVIMLEVGLITPPVGMNVFVVSAASKVPVVTVFRGAFPFVFSAFAVVALLLVLPDLVLWLPEVLTVPAE